jgi:hypothetical protein
MDWRRRLHGPRARRRLSETFNLRIERTTRNANAWASSASPMSAIGTKRKSDSDQSMSAFRG